MILTGGNIEDHTAQLVLNSLYNWKPMQLVMNDVRNMVIFTSSSDDVSGSVQDELKRAPVFLHKTEDAVSIVHAAGNKCMESTVLDVSEVNTFLTNLSWRNW